jgi:hypothetical protein
MVVMWMMEDMSSLNQETVILFSVRRGNEDNPKRVIMMQLEPYSKIAPRTSGLEETAAKTKVRRRQHSTHENPLGSKG